MGKNRLRRLPVFLLILVCVMALFSCEQVSKFLGFDNVVTWITVTKKPTKVTYFRGQDFNPAGMEVTATFLDGSKKPIAASEYTVALMSPFDMTTTGKKPVQVDYVGGGILPTFFDIAVVVETQTSAYLDFITVTKLPTKTEYGAGEAFEPDGLEVTATYVGKESRLLADFEYTLSAPDMNTVGARPIVVNSDGKIASFFITVTSASDTPPVSIAVTTPPEKTAYVVNDVFDPAGMVVTATYRSLTKTVTGYSLSAPDMSTTGTKPVTVAFGGQTASFLITVNSASGVQLTSITVSATLTKTDYFVNDVFTSAGLVVTAAYSDSSEKTVTGYTLSTPAMNTEGQKTITVTFEGKTASFTITVHPEADKGDVGVIIY